MAKSGKIDLTYHVDPRLPIGDDLRKSDPTHPGNIIKKLLETGNQATTDSMYDNKPKRLPKGVTTEAFQSVMTDPSQTKTIFFIAAVIAVIVSLALVTRANSLVVKIALVFVLVVSIHYLVARLENRTV